MKHGIAFRKLSRTTSHRMLMLRVAGILSLLFSNMSKSRPLSRKLRKLRAMQKRHIITMGKKGDRGSYARASALLLKPDLLPKLFTTFAQRYSERSGGYTRIHKYGHRPGDNAPQAILELVDNPRDIRWEMTSRAVGWDVLRQRLKGKKPAALVNEGGQGTFQIVANERQLGPSDSGLLRPMTRWNLQKVLKYRGENAAEQLSRKAEDYIDHLLATPVVSRNIEKEEKDASAERHERVQAELKKPQNEQDRMVLEEQPSTSRRRIRFSPGKALPGETRGALELARGALGDRKPSSPRLLKKPSLYSRH
ncbi:hypothetical protein MIND_00493000 [Mycena indigotica]|uniref:Ribosomal protein L17 n=1 Tax=Mycena indigotica TaxID=2126181 RepID=A0A8H6SZ80_9AGAR|nr:uncharacterized protein MIND_00493000 [Mycena indigotica]KAF7307002.1 hypothetical protein MIND_00493000 [Mycena indigotica]